MQETILGIVLAGIAVYLLCGLIFSILFISKGLKQLDEGTHGTGIGFKLIILPGCIILWPLLFTKWKKIKNQYPITTETGNGLSDNKQYNSND